MSNTTTARLLADHLDGTEVRYAFRQHGHGNRYTIVSPGPFRITWRIDESTDPDGAPTWYSWTQNTTDATGTRFVTDLGSAATPAEMLEAITAWHDRYFR